MSLISSNPCNRYDASDPASVGTEITSLNSYSYANGVGMGGPLLGTNAEKVYTPQTPTPAFPTENLLWHSKFD